MFELLSPALFCAPSLMETRREVMKNTVKFIEIETSSFCNRKCFFCPNCFLDRHSFHNYIDESLYLSILEQLKNLNYSERISLHRYNEPLADPNIFKRIEQARKLLPKAKLLTTTNGDFLDKQTLDNLIGSGLDEIYISPHYFDEGDAFTLEKADDRVRACLEQMKVRIDPVWEQRNECSLFQRYQYNNFTINIKSVDMATQAENRAGQLSQFNREMRISPCLKAFTHLAIDYNGKMMPCCNFRSDNPEHHDIFLGDLNSDELIDVYFSERSCNWRRRLFPFDSNLPDQCRYCTDSIYNKTNENVGEAENFLKTSLSEFNQIRADLKKYETFLRTTFPYDLREATTWCYRIFLGREPENPDTALRVCTSISDLRNSFLYSSEYASRKDNEYAEFLSRLNHEELVTWGYRLFLERDPEASYCFESTFVSLPEFRNHFIQSEEYANKGRKD